MSISYRLRHTTRFTYSNPVSVCHNNVCLLPRSGATQRVRNAALSISPEPTTSSKRNDKFGNTIHAFSIEAAHGALVIQSRAHVTLEPGPDLDPAASLPWEQVVQGISNQTDPEWLDVCPLIFDSSLARASVAARELAQISFQPGRPILEASYALMAQIYNEFQYKPGSTGVDTNSDSALQLRSGVCQDFAHVAVAGLRSLRIPARYVSGYLRTVPPAGERRLVGADQSHAWFAVYCGPSYGWVDLDPTNNVAVGTDHIRLAVGRDYSDVAPVRGVFLGGGNSQLTVEVDVEPVA